MKTIAMILFLCLIVISCEEKPLDEPAPPPPWVPKEYTIEVEGESLTVIPASKNKLTEGSGLSLVIRTLPGRILESATVNGTSIPVSGTELTYPISDIKNNFIIKVVTKPEPVVIIPTRTDTIVSATRPWYFGAHDYFKNNQWETYMTLTEGQKTDYRIFGLDGYVRSYDAVGNYKGKNEWKWDGVFLIWGDENQKHTYVMTDTTLVLYQNLQYIVRKSYWRKAAK